MADFLDVDIGTFLDILNILPSRVEKATDKILDRAATVALQAKQREIAKTYARPIPTNSQKNAADKQITAGKKVRIKGGKKSVGQGGKPAWKRSGDWAAQQRITTPSALTRQIGPSGSSEEYEERLANLPTGALGINRTNKAKENAEKTVESQLRSIMEQEILNALGG